MGGTTKNRGLSQGTAFYQGFHQNLTDFAWFSLLELACPMWTLSGPSEAESHRARSRPSREP
jgi:hypothetical protein